jgi:hypothetical protein
MLKITITETPTERKWVLEGRLMGPWVNELRIAWKRMLPTRPGRCCTIELNDVSFIDKSGERLLRALSRKGAQLIADGLYTKHVVEKLKIGGKCNPQKLPLLLFVAFLAHTTILGIGGQRSLQLPQAIAAQAFRHCPHESRKHFADEEQSP